MAGFDIETDIVVAGGGLAGMIAAASLARAGYQTLMIEPQEPVIDGADHGSDWRSTAFLRPARQLFEQIGIWDALAPHATPLDALRIVDTVRDDTDAEQSTIRSERLFEGRETADEPFGWNFLNWVMKRELTKALPAIDGLTCRYGVHVSALFTRSKEARLTLSDGRRVRARLVVGADGRHSKLRQLAGVSAKTTDYGQKSLAFAVRHEMPHENISTEVYREGGPFTMVPLPDHEGQPASAVVWMSKRARADELLAMDEPAFNAQMNARAANVLGQMEVISHRAGFDIITQTSAQLSSERLALIAEAAHVFPPIGAQGLNTSINDVIALLEALAQSDDPGAQPALDAYATSRKRDIKARATAIDLFNRVARADDQITQYIRLIGLKAAHDITPLRKGLMKAGLNPL